MADKPQNTRVGKYELEEFLGGGMSHVYRAKDSVLGRRVAVKILTEAGGADAETKARFLQEARTASNISHENIINVFDFGEDQGRPFIVMEFLEGESSVTLRKRGHLGDFPSRLKILDPVRTRHRLHPHQENYPSRYQAGKHQSGFNGQSEVDGFGIAKSEGIALTRAGFTLGNAAYMAPPEQVLGQPVTAQADVYAFGILMFEVLTGLKPITGESVEKIFNQILYQPIGLEPLAPPKFPAAIGSLIERCTAKPPAQRPPGLGVVVEELEQILDPSRPVSWTIFDNRQPAAQPESPPGESSMFATVTTMSQTPVPHRAVNLDGLPGFVRNLPGPLQSQAGLMILACVGVVVVMAVVYVALSLAHVI